MSIGDMQFRKSCRRPLDCFGKDTARPYGVAARWTRQHTERNVVPLGSTAAEVLDVAIPQVDSPTSFGLGPRLQDSITAENPGDVGLDLCDGCTGSGRTFIGQ